MVRAAEWLWTNPVLQREWAGQRRSPSWPRRVASWLCLALLLIAYAGAAHLLSRGARTPWEVRAFLLFLCLLYLVWMGLITPGWAAARIAGEYERQTWQALLLTALRPSQVVMGKLVATLWSPLQALVLLLPLLAMGVHAARLPLSRIALILAVLFTATLAVAAIGLWLSHRCPRTRVAAALAYTVTGLGFWMTLINAPSVLVHGEVLWWYASPIWQVGILCMDEPDPSPLGRPMLPEWLWFLLGWGTLAALALALLNRRVAASDRF